MEDGIFQLLFLGLLILASVFDAVGRRRKRRKRMEEMEREEAAGEGEGAGAGTSARWPADPGSAPEDAGTPSPRETPAPAGTRAGGRETADSMVPDDLWAILTGEERSGEGRGEGPSTPGQLPGEDASGGWDSGTRETPERVPPMREEGGRDREPSWGDQPSAPAEDPPDWQPAPPPVVVLPDPPRMPPRAPAPLPSRGRTPGILPGAFPSPPGDRAQVAAGSMYVNLLREGGSGSLRQAIVLTEVFGTPVALRSPERKGGGFPLV